MSYIWKKVSEWERQKIKNESEELLEKFARKLVSVEDSEEELVEREDYEREENGGKDCDDNFRRTIFENAPEKKGDFIMAEKKKW
jgi:hypothetical protein